MFSYFWVLGFLKKKAGLLFFDFKTQVKSGHLTDLDSSNSFPGQQRFLIRRDHIKNMHVFTNAQS